MKSPEARTHERVQDCAKDEADPAPSEVLPGQIYSFRTRPFCELSPPSTGRFAAFKVIGLKDDLIIIAVLDGIWSKAPTLEEVRSSTILMEHRPMPMKVVGGRPSITSVFRDLWQPTKYLDDFNLVGTQAVTREEQAMFERSDRPPFGRYSRLDFVNEAAEGEWRWANEREAITSELEQLRAKRVAAFAVKQERYRKRLSKLTWEQLESETPFDRWSQSPPYPPEEFTAAARATIRKACEALKELGPKPRRREVRAILKDVVLWFNEADESAGGVIDTEERADICALLEEMAYVAQQNVLIDEVDRWREW